MIHECCLIWRGWVSKSLEVTHLACPQTCRNGKPKSLVAVAKTALLSEPPLDFGFFLEGGMSMSVGNIEEGWVVTELFTLPPACKVSHLRERGRNGGHFFLRICTFYF